VYAAAAPNGSPLDQKRRTARFFLRRRVSKFYRISTVPTVSRASGLSSAPCCVRTYRSSPTAAP
jgi:hypothetical protein